MSIIAMTKIKICHTDNRNKLDYTDLCANSSRLLIDCSVLFNLCRSSSTFLANENEISLALIIQTSSKRAIFKMLLCASTVHQFQKLSINCCEVHIVLLSLVLKQWWTGGVLNRLIIALWSSRTKLCKIQLLIVIDWLIVCWDNVQISPSSQTTIHRPPYTITAFICSNY